MTVDAESVPRAAQRGRLPLLTAAVVIVLAVATTTMLTGGSGSEPSATPSALAHANSRAPADPEASASAAARSLLRGVPLPPGARASDTEPAVLGRGGMNQLSSLEAEASGVWLAPGTMQAAVAFARAHPAPRFVPNCTCGGPDVKWVNFFGEHPYSGIVYVVAPYAAGVAIKITVIVPWVPPRPAWSQVANTATSVDVTIERIRQFGSVGGAPTVRRTLTGDATRRLIAIANRLRPEAPADCIGPVIIVDATDRLVFHEPRRTITFTMISSICAQFTVEVTGHKPAYLETGALATAVLRELGLPPDYGHY